MLALHLDRPVRMHYSRAESFVGHVHRHPATIWMRHHATADGEIVKIEARFVMDGGAYASTSSAVLLNAITHTQGPYRCPNAVVDGWAIRTNHLPCGAMRGFGVVQACFAHESQMDRLAAACGLDPVEIRVRNAIRTGDPMITGQVLRNVAPVERCLRETEALPLTHGYTDNSRGIGVSDMARALRGGEPARASGEMAAHVVDIMVAALEAADSGKVVELSTTMTRPAPMPADEAGAP